MNDFDFDIKEKKSIARGAYHKKNGSKSKKCSLPSDNLTAKELRAMSGEVKNYKLSEPMGFKEFRKMPVDLQNEYIRKLCSRFNLTTSAVMELFGVSHKTAFVILSSAGVHNAKGHRMSKEDASAFEFWLSDKSEAKEPAEEAATEEATETEEPAESTVVPAETAKADLFDTLEEEANRKTIEHGSMFYRGDTQKILRDIGSLFSILPDEKMCVRVEFWPAGEEEA